VKVKVLEADDKGRVRLSRKALLDPPARKEERASAAAPPNRRSSKARYNPRSRMFRDGV
jgi:predicted RNA-binding protein with RPS1 domain